MKGEEIVVRRLFIGIVFFIICFCQVSILIADGSSAIISASEVVVFDEEGLSVDSLESIQALKVSSDNFGGYIYCYEDSNGNKFVTNSPGTISSELLLADAGMSTGKSDIVEVNNAKT